LFNGDSVNPEALNTSYRRKANNDVIKATGMEFVSSTTRSTAAWVSEPGPTTPSRVRHWLKSAVTFGMFYHLEHHLFPRVPLRQLPALAARLDDAAPDLTLKQVF
jgi:Fatty acid desaturase